MHHIFIFLHAMSPFYYGQILSFTTCKGSPTLLMGRGLSRPSTCRSSRVPCSTPTRVGISTAPPRCSSDAQARDGVHPKNNGEVLPKFRLRKGQNMEHDPIYTYSDCPTGQPGSVTVINMQRWIILHIYKFVTLPDGI